MAACPCGATWVGLRTSQCPIHTQQPRTQRTIGRLRDRGRNPGGLPDWSCLASVRGKPVRTSATSPCPSSMLLPLAMAFSSSAETGSLRPRESTPRWRGTSNSTPRVQIGGMAVASPAVGPNPLNGCAPRRKTSGRHRRLSYGRARRYGRPSEKSRVRTRIYSRDRRRCPTPRAERPRLGCPAETGRSGPETAHGPGRAACQESGPLSGNRTSLHARLLGC